MALNMVPISGCQATKAAKTAAPSSTSITFPATASIQKMTLARVITIQRLALKSEYFETK